MKIRIPRPRLRVSQGESAFASGNARWTNIDLDPIAKDRRKWGVSSLIGKLILNGVVYIESNKTIRSILDLRCLQCGHLAICQ
jgi:cytosine/uracil/thiamine/allantoin permease